MISHTTIKKSKPKIGGNTVKKKGRKENLLPFAFGFSTTLADAAAFCMTLSDFLVSTDAALVAFSAVCMIALMMIPYALILNDSA
jgi:hypothetical protein